MYVRQSVGSSRRLNRPHVMGDLNAGIFELAGENTDRALGYEDARRDYHARLKALAVESGRPITFGLFSRKDAPGVYKDYVKLLDDTAAAGGRMFAQVHSRSLSVVLSFETRLPFDRMPEWRELRARPLDEQRVLLRGDNAIECESRSSHCLVTHLQE